MTTNVDMTGDTLYVDEIAVAGTVITDTAAELNALHGLTSTTTELNLIHGLTSTAAELNTLHSVTAGTTSASKALVVDSSKTLDTLTVTSLTGTTTNATTLKLAAGGLIDADVGTATLSSNAATVTKHANVITTESLTTAAGSSQALAITLAGVAAGDLAFVQESGGTNTRVNHNYIAACTSNTITVTVRNTEPTNALNGTLIFNLLHIKSN